MTDELVRLLDDEGSDLLRSLISAGREEEPSSAALQRTLAAVGAGVALSAAAATLSVPGSFNALGSASSATVGVAQRAASSLLGLVGKWLALGVVIGTVASGAAYSVTSPPAARSVARLPAAAGHGPAVAAAPHLRAPQVSPEAPELLPEVALSARVVAEPPVPSGARPATEPKSDPGVPLSAEVAALDRARQALSASDPARALELLSGYEARFPEARMLPEALYLRLEAFTRSGDPASAESIARRILRAYPASPHAARARAALRLEP
jgi:hypothetical protein